MAGAPRVAAALTFYVVLSLAPLIFIFVGAARLLVGPNQALHALETQLQPLLGSKGTQGVDVVARASAHQIAATPLVISFVLILIAVFALFRSAARGARRSLGGAGATPRSRSMSERSCFF